MKYCLNLNILDTKENAKVAKELTTYWAKEIIRQDKIRKAKGKPLTYEKKN